MEKKVNTKVEKISKVTNLKVTPAKATVKATSTKTTQKETNNDPLAITLKKQEVKRVIQLFTGNKNTPKISINDISKVLNVSKKQVMRVLHTNNLKTYKESSLK
jgi:hypothetical protein